MLIFFAFDNEIEFNFSWWWNPHEGLEGTNEKNDGQTDRRIAPDRRFVSCFSSPISARRNQLADLKIEASL